MKQVAVVILNWNGAHLLREYLPSVLRDTAEELADIVVADNGSSDDSLHYLAKQPRVQVLELDKNYGFAEGYNRAIAQLEHQYVVLLNSDARTTPGWLEPLLSVMEEQPEVVSVQPKILWERKPHLYEYAGAQGGYLDLLGYPFCRGRIYATLEQDKGQYSSEPEEVFWTSGAAMMVRRIAFVRSGGFDSRYFAHQEEIDLCWRWHCEGFRLLVVPKSVIYHLGGASLGKESPHKTFLNFRNNLRMLYKLLPRRRLYPTLTLRLLLDLVAALTFLLQGKPKDAWAVVRADWAFLTENKVRPHRFGREEAFKQLYPYSILLRYYIHDEKHFSQLKKRANE